MGIQTVVTSAKGFFQQPQIHTVLNARQTVTLKKNVFYFIVKTIFYVTF